MSEWEAVKELWNSGDPTERGLAVIAVVLAGWLVALMWVVGWVFGARGVK